MIIYCWFVTLILLLIIVGACKTSIVMEEFYSKQEGVVAPSATVAAISTILNMIFLGLRSVKSLRKELQNAKVVEYETKE